MYNDHRLVKILDIILCSDNLETILNRELFKDVTKKDRREVADFLALFIEKIGIDKRIDNLRVNSLNNISEYNAIKLEGTRKFFDKKIELESGEIYLIGFNHD